jgi:lambda repressor-like predicted transcriptional regulator
MSSKKITDADKLEIVDLYRQTGDTTASLASRYGVSNSTISRLLKTSIPEAEYEVLIQQKRGVKGGNEEDSLAGSADSIGDLPTEISLAVTNYEPLDLTAAANESIDTDLPPASVPTTERDLVAAGSIESTEESSAHNRRVRRRSSAPLTADDRQPIQIDRQAVTDPDMATPTITIAQPSWEPVMAASNLDAAPLPTKTIIPAPAPRTPVLRDILADSNDRYFKPPAPPETATDDGEEDPDAENVNALAAMFGEEIADSEDDDDDNDGEDWDEEATSSYQQLDRDRFLTEDRLHVQLTPLSQAILPRTCYIVIDKFAELIVRPLKDFADLGQIASEEIQQRTLPVFDNHRVAKRFSNQRTQRVIKVPDSRIFHKTIQHLRSKGITCLLVDGNIYSLN